MTAPVPHLNNSQVGELLCVSESMASYLRNGDRGPSARVQRNIVENLGGDFDSLNAAIIARERSLNPDPQQLVQMLDRLSETASVEAWRKKKLSRERRTAARRERSNA